MKLILKPINGNILNAEGGFYPVEGFEVDSPSVHEVRLMRLGELVEVQSEPVKPSKKEVSNGVKL